VAVLLLLADGARRSEQVPAVLLILVAGRAGATGAALLGRQQQVMAVSQQGLCLKTHAASTGV
jgi:hypothetical protein